MARRKTRPIKGALIKGMTKNPLPAGALTSPYFEETLKEVMKGHPGVYALYKDQDLYYVGLTKDLHGRIKWHMRDKHSGKWNKFDIFKIGKVRYLKDIETLLVNVGKPKANLQKGKIPKRGVDLTSMLRKKVRKAREDVSRLEDSLKK